ncbi:MAG TPA: hypothetical protein VF020_12160, partial [Chthoniobacterales bacterium]
MGENAAGRKRKLAPGIAFQIVLETMANLVDAMVLSGCRNSSSLTKNEKLHTKGGTYRRKQGTEQPKRSQSKPNR